MNDLTLEALEIRASRQDSNVAVSWHGVSDAPDPSTTLSPYLDGLVAEIAGEAVEIDFSAMEYMNSATIAPIVRFIRALDAVASRVLVIYDAERNFQRTTFSAIKALAIVLPKLEVRPR